MQALAPMLAGDPTKAYQQSAGRQQTLDTGNADVAAEKLLGLSLPGMFNQGMPGASPMGGQPPQGQPGMVRPPTPPQMGGMPQQPSGGPPLPPVGGPPQGAVPGAIAMTPPSGGPPPMQGGMPTGGQPPMQPMQPMGGGPPQGMTGGLTLEKAVMALQQGAQRDPSLADPRVLSRALMKMSPLIQWQSREQMLAFREWAVGQQNLRSAAGLESRERNVDVQQQGATERTQAGVAGRAAEGEANRGSRERIAELGANTRTAIASMSAQARKEIADQQATGRLEIAKLSAATRKEINQQNMDVKREIFDASEEGRMDRAFMGSEDRRAGIESRERNVDVQQAGATKRTETQQQGQTERTAKREEGVQGRFDVREARIQAQNAIKNDQQHQTLEIRRQQLERQITQGNDRSQLSQWRAIVDAQNKRAREIITSSGPTGMSDKDRKKLLDEQDKFYRSQIEQMNQSIKGGGKGGKGGPASGGWKIEEVPAPGKQSMTDETPDPVRPGQQYAAEAPRKPMGGSVTPELSGGMGGRSGLLTSPAPKSIPPETSKQGSSVFKNTPEQEADKYLKHYKDDLFGAIKGIDSSPLWGREDGIRRAAAVKQAIIDRASPKDIQKALQIERQFEQSQGQSYSQYQQSVFGQKQDHPKGLTDWLRYFDTKQRDLPPP